MISRIFKGERRRPAGIFKEPWASCPPLLTHARHPRVRPFGPSHSLREFLSKTATSLRRFSCLWILTVLHLAPMRPAAPTLWRKMLNREWMRTYYFPDNEYFLREVLCALHASAFRFCPAISRTV